jgi:hypothetical protein
MRTHRGRFVFLLALAASLLAALACESTPTPSMEDIVATSVAATFAAQPSEPTSIPTLPEPTAIPTQAPTTPPPAPTPPPDGVSMNCDGTYQRLRIVDGGASGKTAYLDSWAGGAWVNVWSLAGGDPMVRQIENVAGLYGFDGCQQLLVIPLRYSGSGAILELHVYVWNGSGLSEVYAHDGVHGDWQKSGATIAFTESLYLFGEPNCCPCNQQILQHTWNGAAFIQTSSQIVPTYEGAPPDYCTP